MQLTQAADYAVRAMIHLAGLPQATRVTLPDLASAIGSPAQFLSKVLQQMVKARLVVSQRGGGGGFQLAVDPEQVSLFQVVEAIEGPTALNRCLIAGHSCNRQSWCAAHFAWMEAQEAMVRVLQSASIARLVRESATRREIIEIQAAQEQQENDPRR